MKILVPKVEGMIQFVADVQNWPAYKVAVLALQNCRCWYQENGKCYVFVTSTQFHSAAKFTLYADQFCLSTANFDIHDF